MEIVVTGRHVQIPDRFRELLDERLGKVPALAPKVHRIDVVVTHEQVARGRGSERVEITCRAKGPVIRAEAALDDKYAALDAAVDRLMERLRRVNDKRRVSRGRRVPESVAHATARIEAGNAQPPSEEAGPEDTAPFGAVGNSPIEVREKVHTAAPMSLEDAVNQMELVGHDFFLFHDIDTDRPSVVYRRRGWSYGVLHLETEPAVAATG